MRIHTKLLVFTATFVTFAASSMQADEVADLKAQLQTLQQHTDVLQHQLETVQQQLQKVASAMESREAPAPSPVPASSASTVYTGADKVAASGKTEHGFLERKPGKSLTFYTPGGESAGGEITAYGNLDVSVDGATKGSSGLVGPDEILPSAG